MDTQAWYTSPQVLAAIAAIGGGVFAVANAFHIPLPFSAGEITEGLAGLLAFGGGGYALYRRIKAGLNPANDAPKITLLPRKEN